VPERDNIDQANLISMKSVIFFVVFSMITTSVAAQDKSPSTQPNEEVPKDAEPKKKTKSKIGQPTTALDFLLRGNAKQGADNMKGALEDYNECIKIDEEFARGYLSRGSVKFILQDFEAAIVDFNMAIDFSEKEIEECNKRKNVKIILEDHKGATKEANKVAAMRPILAEALFNRGNVKYFLEDKTGCCEDLQKSGDMGYLQAYNYIRKYCQD
jgi:tetratricopeptide (TPR) repeat protein